MREVRQQITQIRNKDRKEANKRYITQLRQKYNTQRKQAHRQIFSDPEAPEPLEEVIHPLTKHSVTDPAGIQDAIHTYYSTLLAAPPPADESPPPWAAKDAMDRMQSLHTNTDPTTPMDMFTTITDPTTFHTLLSTLPKGKTPGPDRIPNELLLMAPEATSSCSAFG